MASFHAQSDPGLKERFYRDFQNDVTALREQIEQLSSLPSSGNERSEAIDDCLAGIDRLSHEVKDASSYIPPYDQRSYSQKIKDLAETLQNTRNSFSAPKKFSFKTRKAVPASLASANTQTVQSQKLSAPCATEAVNSTSCPTENAKPTEPPKHFDDISDGIQDGPGVRRPSLSHATNVTVTNHQRLHLKLPASSSHATSSSTLSNLQHSVIDLSAPTSTAPFSALYLKNIKNSLIICGQVAGAIHITNIQNTILVLSTRQFRMHSSQNIHVYLHAASRPIIEDCTRVRFAPLPRIFAAHDVSGAPNRWNEIDDFGWLRSEPSPHFSLLDAQERVADDVWRDKVINNEDLDDVFSIFDIGKD